MKRFTTTHIDLAAALMTCGAEVMTKRLAEKTALFSCKKDNTVALVVDQFQRGVLHTNITVFMYNRIVLKRETAHQGFLLRTPASAPMPSNELGMFNGRQYWYTENGKACHGIWRNDETHLLRINEGRVFNTKRLAEESIKI